MIDRRNFIRLLSLTFAAPLPVLRHALDPLLAVPSAIAELTPLHLIGSRTPVLREPRWNDAKLLREPAQALETMTRTARADGIELWARSGHRTLAQQRYLWNAKFRGQDSVRAADGGRGTLEQGLSVEEKVRSILAYTAFPGTSRHHWGTEVDMAQSFSDRCADYLLTHDVDPQPAEGATDGAADLPADLPESCLPAQRWLLVHAQEYGWCRVYDQPRGGFRPEPWHWSYLPFAVPALARYMAEVGPELLRDRDIDGDAVILDDFAAYRDGFLLGVHPSALPPAAEAAPAEPATAPASDPAPAAEGTAP
jgi:LAS superfamily LD-carboxypeptidase LdcB